MLDSAFLYDDYGCLRKESRVRAELGHELWVRILGSDSAK